MRLTLIATPSLELTAEQINALPWLPMKMDNVRRMLELIEPPTTPTAELKLATMRPKPFTRGWYRMTSGGWKGKPLAICFVTPLGIKAKHSDLNKRDLLRLAIAEGSTEYGLADFVDMAGKIYPHWLEESDPGLHLHILSHVYRIDP